MRDRPRKPLPLAPIVALFVIAVALAGPAAGSERSADEQFRAFLEEIYRQRLERSPLLAAGWEVGRPTAAWDDLSEAASDAEVRQIRANLERLQRDFEPDDLSPGNRVQHRVLADELRLLEERHRWRGHFYPLNQIVGLHLQVPGVLTGAPPFRGVEDARIHIARIAAVEVLFDQLVRSMQEQVERGLGMPGSLYPRLLEGAQQVIAGAPFDDGPANPVWSDLTARLDALELDSGLRVELEAEARAALTGPYRSAYRSLIAALEAGNAAATFDGGVWQLPDGERFYRFLLRQFTTTDMTPEAVHELGIDGVQRVQREMEAIMRRTGFDGSLQEFFRYMRADPRFYYENTESGRAAYLERARGLVEEVSGRVEDLVFEPPTVALEVRRFEAYREKSAPGAFYEAAPEGGKRPAVFYVNLHDMAGVPVYELDSLVYHETIPGHHLQISAIRADPDIPTLRKLNVWWVNSAFVEGWALYAERLAAEIGLYGDPYAEFGRLSGELWRASRLVVDTGLHAKKWSRERAIAWLDENTPSVHSTNVRAVDRYIAVPGQATSFTVGMETILDARSEARAALGDAFDIRGFHDAVLRHGFVPLTVMEESVATWTEEVLARSGRGRSE